MFETVVLLFFYLFFLRIFFVCLQCMVFALKKQFILFLLQLCPDFLKIGSFKFEAHSLNFNIKASVILSCLVVFCGHDLSYVKTGYRVENIQRLCEVSLL